MPAPYPHLTHAPPFFFKTTHLCKNQILCVWCILLALIMVIKKIDKEFYHPAARVCPMCVCVRGIKRKFKTNRDLVGTIEYSIITIIIFIFIFISTAPYVMCVSHSCVQHANCTRMSVIMWYGSIANKNDFFCLFCLQGVFLICVWRTFKN